MTFDTEKNSFYDSHKECMKKLYNTEDPYATAIASLVKKTLLVIGVFILLITSGIGFIMLKTTSKEKTASQPSQQRRTDTPITPRSQLLGAQKQETITATPLQQQAPQQTQAPIVSASVPTATKYPNRKQVTIYATPALDGYITQNGVIDTTSELRVGSTENAHIRAYISFNIQELDAKKLKKAQLNLYQKESKNNMFQTSAEIIGDLVKYGGELDAGDYAIASIEPNFIRITNTADEGIRQCDVTEAVRRIKHEGKNTLQIRVRVSDEQEYKNAYIAFESAENTLQTGHPPQLIIETLN